MDSKLLPPKTEAAGWAELQPELLSLISGNLQHAAHIIRFRSVCRSWRSSTSPPRLRNKISPFFPLKLPHYHAQPIRNDRTRFHDWSLNITAGAVYLLRPRHDPSKLWMVSVHEPVAGKLFPRHALTNEEFEFPAKIRLEYLSRGTRIARSYSRNKLCSRCKGIKASKKVAFLSNHAFDDHLKPDCDESDGLCREIFEAGSFGFMSFHLGPKSKHKIHDIVKFRDRIYAVDFRGDFYVVDGANLELVQLGCCDDEIEIVENRKRFVVSDGDLYVVVLKGYDHPPECYRIVVDEANAMIRRERVEDLGDKVLFLARDCSFSVSARDLPRPWKGNCVVYVCSYISLCVCDYSIVMEDLGESRDKRKEAMVFHFGDADQYPRFRPISSLQGYSDLFAPPSRCFKKPRLASYRSH